MTVDLGPADLADGEIRAAAAPGLDLGLARLGDRYVAFEIWCTHAECPLTDGWLEDEAIRCACHGALFALADGSVLEGPAVDPIRVFPARLNSAGRIEAETPIVSA